MSGGKLIQLPSGPRVSPEQMERRKATAEDLRVLARAVEEGVVDAVLCVSLSLDNRAHRITYADPGDAATLTLFAVREITDAIFQPSAHSTPIRDMLPDDPPSEE